jgi:alpha-tubulin suppressor-like RCC1 family protein
MKKILVIVLAVILTLTLSLPSVTVAYLPDNTLEPMYYSCTSSCLCGPSSGVSIGNYYKYRDPALYGNNYAFLPGPSSEMYNRLHAYMDTAILGTTYPYNYGPGFVEMALHYGYDNFSYVHYETVAKDDYEVIVEAIDNGWPVALASTGLLVGFRGVDAISTDEQHLTHHWPCTVWHFIAIKGYDRWYEGHDHVVICTDSWSWASNLYLDWDELIDEVGEFLEMVIIKDVDPDGDGPFVEDFEWGNDGIRLANWQSNGGEVDWEVTVNGDSVAEIDDYEPHTGTKCARFYKDGTVVRGYYSLKQPSYIGFWVKKDSAAYASFINGDGSKIIDVKFNSAEELRYYTGSAYIYVTTLSPNTWYHIEFKNINWGAGTYDIYVDGSYEKTATMRSGPGYPKNLYFESVSGSGTFWIDDIIDLIPEPEATTVELLPETDSNPVDTYHIFTATVYDQVGCEMEGVDVTWSISGVGSFSGTPESPTDANGQADAGITSSFPGTSTVRCEVTGNPSVYDTATKDWTYTPQATTLELLPGASENPVDTSHNLTATVYDQFGYEMEGVAVTWNISGVGSFSGTPEGVTDANGQANAGITSSFPGTSTVKCEVEMPGIIQVGAGSKHTVGLKPDGTVVAAGWNDYGQCEVGGWTDITQVAAGMFNTVGLKSDGIVIAVGDNTFGQREVGGWTDITQVAAGIYHTVGLKSDGTVVAVGYNTYGQCEVGGWTDITQVAAGDWHTVGLKSDGTVVAVGYFYYGQCDVGGWTDITQVTAGSYHTVGLKSDGTVVAVGWNHGQCDVGGWTDITQVAAGAYHTVGLKSDDTVVAVGWNNYGQCDVGGWTDIAQVAAGDWHTVGPKSDGTVVAVGSNSNGQCDVDGWRGPVYDTATKDWTYTPAATTLELLPETDNNPVDTTHNLTATVYDQFGYVMEGVAVTWNISGVGSFSGTPESPTDVDGQADAVITSSELGTSTVRCEVTGNPSVYDTATKDWTYLEDFEWGNDGDSLEPSGGFVEWTVETDGSSVAEIDTAQAYSGTRSGRFYYDGSSDNILAYHSQDSPEWRGFYLRKDKNAVAYTITGDGNNVVLIRVAKNEFVQYYDGSWQNVCKIAANTWHFIEFRNIDWVAATYDIYVDDHLENSDTPMSASTSYNGLTAYYGGDYEGEFWIDDILK